MKPPQDDDEVWLNNRERRRRPKFGQGWCAWCDRAIVGDDKHCPVCKRRWKTGRENPGAR